MRTFSVSFFIGTLVLLALPRLPVMDSLFWGGFGGAVATLVLMGVLHTPLRRWMGTPVLIGVLLGASYALWVASDVRNAWLPTAWEGEDKLLTGTVADVPERSADGLHFLLDVAVPEYTGRLRVAWYEDNTPDVRAGERWQLLVRGKRPNGFMNPNGFDYEQWLFTQRIGGSGYVRTSNNNQRVAAAPWWEPDSWRQHLQENIETALQGSPMTGLVQGLAIAYTEGISQQQWGVLRNTGTIHLLAISGLHITMVASLGILPVWGIWRLFPILYLWLPLRVAAGVSGGILAIGYSLLAGFNIPTQRTLIMLLVVLVGLVWRRQVPFSVTMSVALLLVLLLDPLAGLSVGFWLSFVTVALLAFLGMRQRKVGKSAVLWMQLVLSLGTIPLAAGFFGMVSLSSPLANLIAIPVVTFVVTPLVLLGMALVGLWAAGAAWVWWGAAILLQGLMWVLDWLASRSLSTVYMPLIPLPWLLLAGLGFVLLWLPRGMPGRWLGALLMLPLVLYQPLKLDAGAFRVSVLDVGQGLASVVQTANHTLVFDTGAKASDSFDTGALVVLPWLRGQGVGNIDTLVVSHADNDHSGGAGALLAAMPVGQVLVSSADTLPDHQVDLCEAGQSWQWDGVKFSVLHPAVDFLDQKNNNRSCVLKITNHYHSALLTADIERIAESWLLKQAVDLQAEVLVLPHHGSKTSSSPAFIQAVAPTLGVVTSGYRNRYHHPHADVIQRYAARDIKLLDTVDNGELRLDFPEMGESLSIRKWRIEHQHLWNRYTEK
ncbi:DNA internalization-related competence protein ComEC/Rec2 [Thiothrix lacustris]|uniref:DNA internalization-related competence protein ComEC/Rec2 n=1 Tax=Thiothrix lacustris TaxID=525917 RepID=A0ABY9MRI4_9GAMM|nr:DNA internalization-related competence protein ComEC/Rec2 [Thiothrix lacustris]WML91212.1 DNA internalization-related competence protein ComEC/Rec2 [Thiothrix lacustris]